MREELVNKIKEFVNDWQDVPVDSGSNRLAISVDGLKNDRANKIADICEEYADSKIEEISNYFNAFENNITFSKDTLQNIFKMFKVVPPKIYGKK